MTHESDDMTQTDHEQDAVDTAPRATEDLIEEVSIDGMCGVY